MQKHDFEQKLLKEKSKSLKLYTNGVLDVSKRQGIAMVCDSLGNNYASCHTPGFGRHFPVEVVHDLGIIPWNGEATLFESKIVGIMMGIEIAFYHWFNHGVEVELGWNPANRVEIFTDSDDVVKAFQSKTLNAELNSKVRKAFAYYASMLDDTTVLKYVPEGENPAHSSIHSDSNESGDPRSDDH